MAVKTITVTEDAYETIKRMKSEEESFSELFLRLGNKQGTVKDILGVLKHTPEESAEFRRRVQAVHEGLNRGLEEHINYVRSRLKHNN